MAQTKHQIQSLLAAAATEPRHRFGQNFMIDQNLVRIVADAGQIGPQDAVIEVGPGTGTLTEELLPRTGHLLAVEIDRALAGMLRQRFAGNESFELIEGDALAGKHELNPQLRGRIDDLRSASGQGGRPHPVKLVANLPYNIASPLIIELLIAGVDLLAFTVQREVAERLRADASQEAYGPLAIMAQLLSRVEMLRVLPPQAFWPPPKVESALVRLCRADRLGARAGEFSRFVHSLFGFRRKTLRKALVQGGHDPQVLGPLGIDPQLRPENLPPEIIFELYRALTA